MLTRREVQGLIWSTTDALRSVIYAKDISLTATRLLFLKYAVDNFVGAKTVEDMQQCAMAQKMFATRDIEKGPLAVESVMSYIDKAFNFDRILSSAQNLDIYYSALFGIDAHNQRKTADSEGFRRILDSLGQLDLAEKEDGNDLGSMLTEELIEAIMSKSYRSLLRAEVATTHQLSNLAGAILDVEESDTFCDLAAGIGVSTIDITGKTKPKVIASDINPSVASVMAMLLIMYGYRDVVLKCQDTIWQTDSTIHGNKLFADIPVGMRNKEGDSKYSDGTLAAVDNVINVYLDEKGLAVLAVPSGFLFKKDRNSLNVRKELIEKGHLKAIIALPPMWMSMHMPTNLLVLSSDRQYEKILFIDASRRGIRDRGGTEYLSETDMQLIVDTVNDPEDKRGFSYVAQSNELIREDYQLLPAHYVVPLEEEEDITIQEIEAELSDLYASLGK